MLRTRSLLRLFALAKKPYVYPYNINKEQHRQYLQKVERQLEIVNNPVPELMPRRKRRLYDQAKFDTDLTDYAAWRAYGDDRFVKLAEYEYPVAFKINLAPKWVKHVFGQGHDPDANPESASKEYFFEDCNLSQYLLYDYRHTTLYKPNIEGYDYEVLIFHIENQGQIEPRKRKVKRY